MLAIKVLLAFVVIFCSSIVNVDAGSSSKNGGAYDKVYAKKQVGYHNKKRALHGADKLQWDDTLAEFAMKYASTCPRGHAKNNKYGENLAWSAPASSSGKSMFKMWYDEGKGYNYSRKTFSEKAGHFTQIVWRKTSKIGCAMVTCPKSTYPAMGDDYRLLVCEYSSPGNVQGQFLKNVRKVSGMVKTKKKKSSSKKE